MSACWDNVNILLGLINIKLSNQEFNYYKAHRNEFKPEFFTDFIQSKVGTYNLSYNVQEPSDLIKEDLPKLFDKFMRGEDMRELYREGRGLGLFIARQIIEGHGGTVRAESEGEGKGSTFFIELPLTT